MLVMSAIWFVVDSHYIELKQKKFTQSTRYALFHPWGWDESESLILFLTTVLLLQTSFDLLGTKLRL